MNRFSKNVQAAKNPAPPSKPVIKQPQSSMLSPLVSNLNLSRTANTYATKNLTPGIATYGERKVLLDNTEYRIWHPKASKLAAALAKGHSLNLQLSARVLYLGASTGTTASHISDLCPAGMVFGIDNAPRVVRELVFLAESRPNIAPVLADARIPQDYANRISTVDWLYQDIAAREQVSIFLSNAKLFLRPGGTAILCLKARSVDFAKKPAEVFAAAEKEISTQLRVLQRFALEPYFKDHCVFICRREK